MPSFSSANAQLNNNIMNNTRTNKAMRLEMVEIDHNRFAAEILHGNARINMTQMAKPFGKRPADWLKYDEAKEYISAIAVVRNIVTADLIEVRQGGTPEMQGTWCNDRRIALRFAQWLSPEFSVAVDDALMRLMLGEAVYAEPVNGVEPIISGGRAWYNYGDAMERSRRRRAKPQYFRIIYGRLFIRKEYFLAMQSYYAWKDTYTQLELPLDFDGQEA